MMPAHMAAPQAFAAVAAHVAAFAVGVGDASQAFEGSSCSSGGHDDGCLCSCGGGC